MSTKALEVQEISVGYGGPPVLHSLSLTVEMSEFVAVLGVSGSGKSTLLKAIAGLLRPCAGSIRIAGQTVSGGDWISPERRGVGWVPQEGALFPHLTVAANVGFGLARQERKGSHRISEMLELVGMSEAAHVRPHELSGGQQQRVALARALAPAPKIVLLDEPFSSLDTQARISIREEIRDLLRDVGASSLLITHDRDEALSLADRVAILVEGRIEQIGTPRDVYREPASMAAARISGDVVRLAVSDFEGDRAKTEIGWVDIDKAQVTDRGFVKFVVMRPEDIIVKSWSAEADDWGEGTVQRIRYLGTSVMVDVALSAESIVRVRVPGDTSIRVGDPVMLQGSRKTMFAG